jgi:hypothetical protein
MTYIKAEFEKKLKELGFSCQCHTNGLYILRQNNVNDRILIAQLICSEPVDELKLGSRNGNVIQSIGHFKLRLSTEVKEPSFLILAFGNSCNSVVELIILPNRELTWRLNKENRISTVDTEIEIVFWLMPDNRLYETTNLGIEGEWYYMSKGLHGRLADETDWCYTKFLNNWERLKMI